MFSAPGVFFAEYARKIEENAGKIGEIQWNPFLEMAEPKGEPAVISGHSRSFPVVFPVISGRFRSFFRSFLVMIPIDSAKSFRFIPNDSISFLFFPFHYTFIPQPLVFMLYNIFPADFPKIPAVSLGGSNYSSYFCNRLQDDSNLSGRATVSPMAPQPQAFFMPKSIIFPASGKRCTDMAAA